MSLHPLCRAENYKVLKEIDIATSIINRSNADGYAEQFGTALVEPALVFENLVT
jgi:hypothetical protein